MIRLTNIFFAVVILFSCSNKEKSNSLVEEEEKESSSKVMKVSVHDTLNYSDSSIIIHSVNRIIGFHSNGMYIIYSDSVSLETEWKKHGGVWTCDSLIFNTHDSSIFIPETFTINSSLGNFKGGLCSLDIVKKRWVIKNISGAYFADSIR